MCSASPKILVLFVCKSCRSSFSLIDEFIKHKTAQHYDEFKQINCVIFEEQISLGNDGGKGNLGIPSPMLSFEPEAHFYTDQSGTNQNNDLNLTKDPLTSGRKAIDPDPLVYSRKFIKCDDEPHQNIQIDAVVGNFSNGSTATVNEIRIPSVNRMWNPSVNLRRLTSSQILKASSSYQNQYDTIIKLEHEEANDVSCSAPTPVLVPVPISEIYFDFDGDSESDTGPFFNQQQNNSSIPKHNNLNVPPVPLPLADQLNQEIFDAPTATTARSDVKPAAADLTCKLCFRKYKNKVDLQTHVNICSLIPRSRSSRACVLCNKLFRVSYLQEHMIRVHGTREEKDKAYKLKCQVCSNKFLYHGELLIHMNSHLDVDEESKPFQCQECDRSFLTKQNLTRHRDRLHSTKDAAPPLSVSDLDLSCNLCLKKYKSKGELHIHLTICKLYHKGGNCFCVPCNKLFCKGQAFRRHMLIFHASEEEKKEAYKFKCQHCTKSFLRRMQLLVHMESHKRKDERSKPFKCKDCDRSFFAKEYLDKHRRRLHSHNELFKCTFRNCKMGYKLETSLVQHFRSHSDPERYHCPHEHICSKNFKLEKDLRIHLHNRH